MQNRLFGIFGLGAALGAAITLGVVASGGAQAEGAKRAPIEYFSVEGTNAPPYTPAIRVGDVVYATIQLATAPGGMPTTTEAQAKAAMDNLAAVLKRAGTSMDNVFKCAVIVADLSKWDDFNKVYRTYFKPGKLPVRSAFGTTGLHLNSPMGVECEPPEPVKL